MAASQARRAFGDRLTAFRQAAHWTQDALGARVGVTGRTLQRWEIGERLPSFHQLLALVHAIAKIDPGAARELAVLAGTTAEAVGLAPATAGAPPPITDTQLAAVERAIAEAADLLDVSPKRVRAAVGALVATTRAAGVTAEQLERVVNAPASTPRARVPRR